ncbi:MAG: NAD(P)H-dependent oxidoreductase [Candidatus Cloacimonas sp.]|jgi:flavodoxin|nr:NAD(P)H-dependent oxidoreductase [Candidatus Cloacimonas sp.]
MNIAIIVHSLSGNTLKFADSLFNKLTSQGHVVNLTQLETTVPLKSGSVHQKLEINFTNLPKIDEAELVLFGGPVWAFGPSPVIIAAMQQIGNLKGKKALSFATMGFFCAWMGGNAAIAWMNRTAGTLGAKVLPGSICYQMRGKLDAQIAAETERIAQLIK